MDSRPSPYLSTLFLKNWAKENPTHNISVIYPDTLSNHVSMPVPWSFYRELTKEQRLEWIRLAVLIEHGGIWLDPCVVFVEGGGGVDGIYSPYFPSSSNAKEGKEDEEEDEDVDTATFYLPHQGHLLAPILYGPTTVQHTPVIHPFSMAAKKRSPLVVSWFNEFNLAVSSYTSDSDYVDHLKSKLKSRFDMTLGGVLGGVHIGSTHFSISNPDASLNQFPAAAVFSRRDKKPNIKPQEEDPKFHDRIQDKDSKSSSDAPAASDIPKTTHLTNPLAFHKTLLMSPSLPLPQGIDASSSTSGPMKGYLHHLHASLKSNQDPDESYAGILLHGSVDDAMGNTGRKAWFGRKEADERPGMVWIGERVLAKLLQRLEGGEMPSDGSLADM
ncbi:hypothetical protein HDU97_006934, partial [Phlyctochytrium planicorne]